MLFKNVTFASPFSSEPKIKSLISHVSIQSQRLFQTLIQEFFEAEEDMQSCNGSLLQSMHYFWAYRQFEEDKDCVYFLF